MTPNAPQLPSGRALLKGVMTLGALGAGTLIVGLQIVVALHGLF